MKFHTWVFLEKSVEKNQVSRKYDKNTGYFTWRPSTFMITPRSLLLRMRNVLDTSCTENHNTHFMFNNFFSENPSVCEIMCGEYGTAKQATDDNKTRRRPFTCWLRPHTHRICSTDCFSMATTVTRTRPNVT